jgi:deoxycytidine triphosphate deaminase
MGSPTSQNNQPKQSVDERDDPHPEAVGILLGDQIEAYRNDLDPSLIDYFDRDQLRAASYGLRLGDEYYQDGELKRLSDEHPYVVIEPHEMAVVSTHEFLHLPRYLIGRWNLRISLVYKGLIWAGAAQVDPGYYGHLYSPLYNLSNTRLDIKRLDHIFTIDFEKTSEYDPNDHGPLFETKRKKLAEYLPSYALKSSVGDLQKQIKEAEVVAKLREEKLSSSFHDLQSTVLIGLSTVFAGLTIVATLPYVAGKALNLPPPDVYASIHLALSVGAFIIASFAIFRTRKLGKSNRQEEDSSS